MGQSLHEAWRHSKKTPEATNESSNSQSSKAADKDRSRSRHPQEPHEGVCHVDKEDQEKVPTRVDSSPSSNYRMRMAYQR